VMAGLPANCYTLLYFTFTLCHGIMSITSCVYKQWRGTSAFHQCMSATELDSSLLGTTIDLSKCDAS